MSPFSKATEQLLAGNKTLAYQVGICFIHLPNANIVIHLS